MKEKGFFNTHLKKVDGLIFVDDETSENISFMKDKIEVRCTSNMRGETLSVSYNGLMISIRVEDVEDIIRETREEENYEA